MAAADPDRYLEEQTRAALAEAIEALDRARVSGVTRVLTRILLRRLKGLTEYEDAIAGVESLSAEVGQVSAILSTCATSLVDAESAQAEQLTPSSEIWWNTRTRSLLRDLRADRTTQGLSLWLRTWVDGLAAQEWARCRSVLSLGHLPDDASGLADRMRTVTDALESGELGHALQPLDELLHPGTGEGLFAIEPEDAVRLAVLRTRMLGQGSSDVEARREAAADALHLAGDDSRRRALALAGAAETQLDEGDVESARASVKSIGTTHQSVDALVVSGLLFERDGLWARADATYDRALKADPAATRPELLRPVPARLLVRAARSRTLPPADAVDLLDLALARGVPGEGDYPDQEAHQVRARRLLDLATEQERDNDAGAAVASRARAAESLMKAGRRYAASGLEPQAVELFEQACSLAPEEAEYRWTLAEALRVRAYRPDGTVDDTLLASSRQQMQIGLRIRLPQVDEAWAFITAALIEDNVPDPEYDPALLAERALLLDPDYDLGYAFLAVVLRGKGWLQEAYEVTSGRLGYALMGEDFLFETHLNLLLDLDKRQEALESLDWRQVGSHDDTFARQRAGVLLSLGNEQAMQALAALAQAQPTDYVRILRADAMYATGDRDGARDQYASVWADTRSSPASQVAGWAAFRAGELDEGIALYRDLVERGDPRAAFARDLGQMLLVRGDPGDLDEALPLLERGIDACPAAEELVRMETAEFEYVRDATASTSHAGPVDDLIRSLGGRIRRRVAEVRGARRPADDLAVLLAEGRRQLSEGRSLDAVVTYAGLAGNPDVPEVEHGLMRATRAARREADLLYIEGPGSSGSDVEARQQWATAEEALTRLSSDAATDLRVSLSCRRMVADLIDGHTDAVGGWLDTVNVDEALPELLAAGHVLAHDPPTLWRLYEGLQEVGGQSGSRAAQDLASAVIQGRHVGRAYGLAAADVGTERTTFLSVNPLELRVGAGSEDLVQAADLADATSALQNRIEEDTGVRIPWLHVRGDSQIPSTTAEVRLFGRLVGRMILEGDRDGRLRQLVSTADEILRGHLYRLVGVDDVALWLEGWDLAHIDAPRWEPTDRLDDQLRLARVLRMLIREGVSVRDRQAIVGVLNDPVELDRRHPSATLDALREVRKALGPVALGVADGPVVPIPDELERRICDGLDPERPVWVRPRHDTHRLVTDLRAWLGGQPRRPAVVSVENPLVRPFAWRLLAAEKPMVRVVSREELS